MAMYRAVLLTGVLLFAVMSCAHLGLAIVGARCLLTGKPLALRGIDKGKSVRSHSFGASVVCVIAGCVGAGVWVWILVLCIRELLKLN